MGILKNFSDLFSVGIANIVGTTILTLFWIYLASILEPIDYGQLSYLIAIANVASVAAFLGAGQTLVVYTAKKIRIQSTIFMIVLITGGITSFVIFIIQESIEVSIYVIGYIVFGLISHEILGSKLYGKYSKILISQRVILVIISLTLFYFYGINGIILGYAISFLPYSVFLFRGFKESKVDIVEFRQKVGFMLNNYGKDLSKILNRSLDKLIILPIFGGVVLGNYQLAFQALMMLTILPTIVYQYVLPRQSSGLENKKLRTLTVVLSTILALIVFGLSPIILPQLFPKYEDSILIIQILSFAIIPISITFMHTAKLLALEKSRHVILSSILFLIIQVIGIFVLGERLGIIGLAIATVIASSVEAIYLTIASIRIKN